MADDRARNRAQSSAQSSARGATRPDIRRFPAGETTPEFVLLAVVVAVLTVGGLVMTFSASFVQSTKDTGDAFDIFLRQLVVCAIGVPVMVVAALVDYRIWRRLAAAVFAVAVVASLVVLIPGVGVVAYGARRWIDLGPFTVQPSELLKLGLPLLVASLVARRWTAVRGGDLRALLLPAVPLIAVSMGLVMAGPDLETAALVGVIGGAVLYAAGLPARIMAVTGGVGAVGALAAVLSTPFRRARMAVWLDPMSDPGNVGYQTVQGWIALGNGGWFGVGLGQGRGKWLYVPNAHTDFIFAIIGEELGLVGAMAVLVLFGALAVGGVRTARRAPDPFGRLVAVAISAWLLTQAAINMGSVVGLLPVTGVTLPLLSFGGSSLVVTMLGLGVLLSIARAGRPAPAPAPAATRSAARTPARRAPAP